MKLRNGKPKGGLAAPFGFSVFIFALVPTQIGYQDVAALIARQPAVTATWRQHIRASAFGTIHAATFSFSLPVGTAAPQPLRYKLASIDPRAITLGTWDDVDDPQLQFPTVDRSAKGDRQPVLKPQPEASKSSKEKSSKEKASEEKSAAAPAQQSTEPAVPDVKKNDGAETPPSDKPVTSETVTKPETETAELSDRDIPDPIDEFTIADADDFVPPEPVAPVMEMARLYFGNQPMGDAPGAIQKWAPGEEPEIVTPAAPADPDIKLSALDPKQPDDTRGGESIAPKGEVTGEGKRPQTPAERLNLEGKNRTKAEKCLADAVYFEARGEPVRGQIAVAQVVMNRVFSGFYPRSVCGTVYQNSHRRLACQFTFACDGIPDVITEPQAWVRATRIARDVLDGKYWLPEVNRATHYHAYWVRPSWVREMKRLYKFGVHTFYRPKRWGDGDDVPAWGTAAATSEAIAKL